MTRGVLRPIRLVWFAVFLMIEGTITCGVASGSDSGSVGDSLVYTQRILRADCHAEHWDGYTEYRIRVGNTIYEPTGESVLVRSRLRFPIRSILSRVGGTYEAYRIRMAGHVNVQVQNSVTTFKDWDTYEGSMGLRTFIYGASNNSGELVGFDLSGGYRVYYRSLEFRPQIEYAFYRMKFDEETVRQINYAGIDTLTDYIVPYVQPRVSEVDGTVLRYRIDYSLLYFGGSTILRVPSGLEAEFTAMIAPVCWVSDFDEHLLRDKTAEISSSGRAAYIRLNVGYSIGDLGTLKAGVSYHVITTRGPQKQRSTVPPFWTIEGIPAETMAEWMTVGVGVSFRLARVIPE